MNNSNNINNSLMNKENNNVKMNNINLSDEK